MNFLFKVLIFLGFFGAYFGWRHADSMFLVKSSVAVLVLGFLGYGFFGVDEKVNENIAPVDDEGGGVDVFDSPVGFIQDRDAQELARSSWESNPLNPDPASVGYVSNPDNFRGH